MRLEQRVSLSPITARQNRNTQSLSASGRRELEVRGDERVSVEAPKVIELSWVQSIGYRVSEPNYCGEGERKKLVELEPLLDLLEDGEVALRANGVSLADDFAAVLRTHGRLK